MIQHNEQHDSINEFVIVGDFGTRIVDGPFEVEKEWTLWTIIVPKNGDVDEWTMDSLRDSEGEAAVLIADGQAIGGGLIDVTHEPRGKRSYTLSLTSTQKEWRNDTMTENDNQIPTYSLLQKHEDVAVYRIPDPTENTPAWIRIGLFPWELEGIHIGKAMLDAMVDEDINNEYERAEGVGLRVGFNGPTSRHPTPAGFEDWVENSFDVHSRGSSDDGKKFRLAGASPAELRQMGRGIALYGFAYWWWLENRTSHEIGKQGTVAERPPEPDSVLEDGVLIDRSGERHQTPYDVSQMELLSPEEWETPYEQARNEVKRTVEELEGDVPQFTLAQAIRDVEDGVVDPFEKTDAKQKHDRLNSALAGGDGIGHRLRSTICGEFGSVGELCGDLRDGGKRLRSIDGIGEGKEDAVIDALIDSGEWESSQ